MSRLIRPLLLTATVLLLTASPIVAADAAAEKAGPEETLVNADVTMGEIQVLFKSLAEQADLKLQSDLGIQGKISFRVKNQKLSDAMDMICGPFKCVWKVEDGALVIDIQE